MGSRRLYYDDAYTTRFRAPVAAEGEHRGRPAVELERTYFYPESGGQEADRGTVGGRAVEDVQADDSGRVWHVLAPGPGLRGEVEAEVDWTRRFDAMQQHTGQHVLSAAFERVAGLATVSSHLGDERSTLELAAADADWRLVERVEAAANGVVWEDREVRCQWVERADLGRFALRKPPTVSGPVRIVEVAGWDVSACGGTHTRRTGEVGVIKVVRWEKVRGNVRFEFLCGGRALRDHAWRTESLIEAARRHTLHDRELLAHLERAAGERDALRRRLQELTRRALASEARERVGSPPKAVTDLADSRPRADVRAFALQCLEAGAPWVVAAARGPEPVLVLGRSKSLGGDLRSLVPALLERTRGKGGGSPDLVQAAAADGEALAAAHAWACDAVRALVESPS